MDQGRRYGFGVLRALKGSMWRGICFNDDVSSVFRSAKLLVSNDVGHGVLGCLLVYCGFIVDPRMTFSSVKVAH